MSYKIQTTELAVLPPDEPLFSERCTRVAIVDEGAGEFISIQQQSDHVSVKEQTCSLDSREEWEAIRGAVEQLFDQGLRD